MRNFSAASVALSLGYGVYVGNVVLLPLWLQTQMGYTAGLAGLVLAPSGLMAFLLSPLIGKTFNRVDQRLYPSIGILVFALCSFWRAGFSTDAGFGQLALPQLAIGMGTAMFFAPLFSIASSRLGPDKAALGSGMTNFMRITAGSFGTSLATTFWQRREAVHHAQLAESISAFSPQTDHVLARLGDAGLNGAQALDRIAGTLAHQTTMLAANDVFWVSGWLFIGVIAAVWIARRPFGGGAVTGH